MSIAVLLQHADTLITTPRDVAKLRQLILAQAVQGKLVPQESGDEPVNIHNIHFGLEENFTIPNQWRLVTIAHLLPEFQNGASSRGDINGVNIIVLRLADITNKRISTNDVRRIPINQKDIEKYQITIGDILITRVNGSADIVGNFNLIDIDVNAIYCDHFIRMRLSKELVIPQYIALVGETLFVRNQIKSLFISTAGQKTINQSHISSIKIPLPSLAEQRRIVARVDELMALCDQLEAQLQERQHRQRVVVAAALARVSADPTPANVATLFTPGLGVSPADLRQLILALAVQGKLVPQEEPSLEVDENNSEANFSNLPLNWKLKSLEDTTDIIRGVTFPGNVKSRTRDSKYVACLRTASVQKSIDWDDLIYIPQEYVKNTSQWVKKNDIVISMANSYELVGKVAIVRDVPEKATFGAFLGIVRSSILDAEYLMIVLSCPIIQSQFRESSSQTTNIANISLGKLRSITIPVPPLAEQRRIVARVDALMALVDQLEAQQAHASALGAQVLDAVVGGV